MNEEQDFINYARELLPQYNDQMTDEQILEVYYELKKEVPELSYEELKDMGRKIVPQIVEKMEGVKSNTQDNPQGAKDKIAALKNLGGM